MSKMPSAVQLAMKRWFALLLASVVGAGGVLLGLYWRRSEVASLCSLPLWTRLLTCACLFAALILHARRPLSASLGLRHFAAYPPAWAASLLASGLTLPLLARVPATFIKIGNELVASEVKVDVLVTKTLLLGRVPLVSVKGLRNELTGALSTKEFTTGWIDNKDVASWEAVESEESLSIRPVIIEQVASVWPEGDEDEEQ
jgi:hypothetical protein